MSFERKSMEQLLQQMIDWSRGVSSKITDFRVGSRARTLYESVGIAIEELYDKVFRSNRILIEENIYTVLGFPKRPAIYATDLVVMGRDTPADANYLISAGTVVQTLATQSRAPVQFRTTVDALLAVGTTSVQVPVIALVAGTVGNVEANSIVDFVTKPSGIETVTNPSAFSNGVEEETRDEQKVRFQRFIKSLMRGPLPAIEYGATLAEVRDVNDMIIERVTTARAFEYLPERKGEVDVYIWNGVGEASPALLADAKRRIDGYYNQLTGEPVYGYKSAGIIVYYYSAEAKPVTLKLDITPDEGVTLDELKPYVEREVDDFFRTMNLGQTLIQTALETRVKLIAGVYDVKLNLSLDDGATYTQDNITLDSGTEILVAQKPLIYS